MNYIPCSGASIRSSGNYQVELNPKNEKNEIFFQDYAFKLKVKGKGVWFIAGAEKSALEIFENNLAVDSELLDKLEKLGYEGRPFIRKWVGRGVLEYVES